MQRIAVKSSNIASVGWQANESGDDGTLEVAFLSKKEDEPERVYVYANVPYGRYLAFLNAQSPGSFFATHVRANYESHRVDSDRKEARHGKEEKQEG
jgi:hypothetical protein